MSKNRNKKKRKQRTRRCPHCGAMKKGGKCHSPECVYLRVTPPKNAGLWTPWAMTSLLARMVGKAIAEEGEQTDNSTFVSIGNRIFKWADKAAGEAKQFGIPIQYAQAQINKYDRAVDRIWPANQYLAPIQLVETLQMLVHDIIRGFSERGYTPEQLHCWNWTEAALTALQKYYEADDLMQHLDRIDHAYTSFRAEFWNDTPKKEIPLLMWNVGERFAVAAHNKEAALAIVKKHYGFTNLKASRLVLESKVTFDGKETTYGMLLDLFQVPGIVADFQEAA